MPPQGNLSEQVRILLDPDQPAEPHAEAAAYIKQHGDRQTLDVLMPVVKGPWQRENDLSYLAFRRLLAISCEFLWAVRVKEGPPVFSYYPQTDTEVEAPIAPGMVRRGRLTSRDAGTSLFEFHYEYPIWSPQRDFVKGHPKDQIFIVEPDGSRIPIFDWCRRRDATVICNRCGEDITYQVNLYGCRSIIQNPSHPLFIAWRLGAVQQEISTLEKDIHHLETASSAEGLVKLQAARTRVEELQKMKRRIEEGMREREHKREEKTAAHKPKE